MMFAPVRSAKRRDLVPALVNIPSSMVFVESAGPGVRIGAGGTNAKNCEPKAIVERAERRDMFKAAPVF